MNTRLEPKMTAGWHVLPKAHQSFTDIFFFAYVTINVTKAILEFSPKPEILSSKRSFFTYF